MKNRGVAFVKLRPIRRKLSLHALDPFFKNQIDILAERPIVVFRQFLELFYEIAVKRNAHLRF